MRPLREMEQLATPDVRHAKALSEIGKSILRIAQGSGRSSGIRPYRVMDFLRKQCDQPFAVAIIHGRLCNGDPSPMCAGSVGCGKPYSSLFQSISCESSIEEHSMQSRPFLRAVSGSVSAGSAAILADESIGCPVMAQNAGQRLSSLSANPLRFSYGIRVAAAR